MRHPTEARTPGIATVVVVAATPRLSEAGAAEKGGRLIVWRLSAVISLSCKWAVGVVNGEVQLLFRVK